MNVTTKNFTLVTTVAAGLSAAILGLAAPAAAAPSGVNALSTRAEVTPAIARRSIVITSSMTRRPLGKPARSPPRRPRLLGLLVFGGIATLSRRRSAWVGPVMSELMSSLPVAGVDGTLRRYKGGPGRAHLKTGSLKDVVGIAGYVLGDSGRRYVVVGIVNHARADAARPALEALVERTADDAGAAPHPHRN